MTVSAVPNPEELITVESKVTFLRGLFAGHFDSNGLLVQPLSDWYNHHLSVNELENIAKNLCKSVGVKPRQLDVKYQDNIDAAGSYVEDDSGHHIILHSRYQSKPYEAVAILAHETTHYLLESRKHLQTDDYLLKEELVDLATIYLGFGILIINGFNRHETWFQRMWDACWPFDQELYFGSYTAPEYARQLGHYVGQSTQVTDSDLFALLTPWSNRLFVEGYTKQKHPASYVIQAQKRINTANLVFITTLVLSAVILAVTVFVARQTPKRASAEQIIQKEKIDLLYKQYLLCTQTVSSRQINSRGQGILEEQNLSADVLRCQSLKNEYNSEVESYNQSRHK